MDLKTKPEKNIGSKEHPIPTSRKLTKRALLAEHLKAIPDADFSRYRKASNQHQPSPYVINLLSARGMNFDAFKIALFLFDRYLIKNNFKKDFVVSTSLDTFIDNRIGSKTQCYFGKKNNPVAFKMPFPSLIQILKKENVILEETDVEDTVAKEADVKETGAEETGAKEGNTTVQKKKLIDHLRVLHDLGLITLTEISSKTYDESDAAETIKFVHIALNKGFTEAKINLKWDKPAKEGAVVKQKIKNAKQKAMEKGLT